MESKYHFFVAYPKNGESETNSIMDMIKKRLNIDYELWSYADVKDEVEYFQEVVEPAIENADFVLAFVNRRSEDDYLLKEAIRFCNNLNKSIVPIKFGSGRVRERNWDFRSKVVDIDDEPQRISLIEQIHGWLGLTKVGDLYGSNVLIKTDFPAVISRNNEVLGKTDEDGRLECVLTKGSREIVIESGGCWNQYRYVVSSDDEDLTFEASLKGVRELSQYESSAFFFNPDSGDLPDWDLTHRRDFRLLSSSEDDKKRQIIFNSYNICYKSKLVPYPEFKPREIIHSKGLLIAAWVIPGILAFFTYGATLIITLLFFVIRAARDAVIRKQNERRRRQQIEQTDSKNQAVWYETNRKMNLMLDEYGFPHVSLANLGTPSDYFVCPAEYRQSIAQ